MHTKQFDLGSQSVKIETGLIAKQANSSVTVDIDGTVILATLVASVTSAPSSTFLSLSSLPSESSLPFYRHHWGSCYFTIPIAIIILHHCHPCHHCRSYHLHHCHHSDGVHHYHCHYGHHYHRCHR